MSRIEEAWARASGAAARRLDDRADSGPANHAPSVSLEDFPQEIGAADIVTDPVDALRARIQTTTPDIAAPPSVTVSMPVAPPHAPPPAEVSMPKAPDLAPAIAPAAPVPVAAAPYALERPSGSTASHWNHLRAIDPAWLRKLVIGDAIAPVAAEQYRRLAGAVHDLQVEHGLKTLMVTSAVPGEGKTLTIINLALTLSEACKRRVLLLDADLRRPTVHDVLRLPNTRGLSDVLRADCADLPILQLSDYLSVLPAGRLDSPMALTSDRMRVLLERYAASFDWVLLDAAPVGFMPDAQLLARLTRAVLFVIASHVTPHSLVSRAIADIGEDCVIGTVLNRVEAQDIPAAGYYQDY